jgi:DnaJ-class molecular chaperone
MAGALQVTLIVHHRADCEGTEDCGDCGGDGFTQVATDDDPMADAETRCETCQGTGTRLCQGCA